MRYLTLQTIANNILLHTSSMETAINALNVGTFSFLIILDEEKKVLGTITDGDIRRGLIKGFSVHDKVTEFMMKSFVYGEVGGLDHRRKLFGISSRTKFLPILDERGTLASVYGDFVDQISIKTAVVMAGGFGRRLKELTKFKPKPLVHVQGEPLIEHVLQKLEGSKINEIFLTVHYKADQIEKYIRQRNNEAKIHIVFEEKPLGTAGALKNIEFSDTRPFLVSNCDIISDLKIEQLDRYSLDNQCDLLAAVKKIKHHIPFGVVEFDENLQFSSITEKPSHEFYISTGVSLISPKILDIISNGEVIDMPELVNRAHLSGFKVNVFPMHETWFDLGHEEDVKKFNDYS